MTKLVARPPFFLYSLNVIAADHRIWCERKNCINILVSRFLWNVFVQRNCSQDLFWELLNVATKKFSFTSSICDYFTSLCASFMAPGVQTTERDCWCCLKYRTWLVCILSEIQSSTFVMYHLSSIFFGILSSKLPVVSKLFLLFVEIPSLYAAN